MDNGIFIAEPAMRTALPAWSGPVLAACIMLVIAAYNASLAIGLEIATGEPALRGFVHSALLFLFTAVTLLDSHEVGAQFLIFGGAFAARATWDDFPLFSVPCAASSALLASRAPPTPGAAMFAVSLSLGMSGTVPCLEIIAGCFHRAYICALGSVPDNTAMVALYSLAAAPLVVSFASGGTLRQTLFGLLGLGMEARRLAGLCTVSPPAGVAIGPPPLARARSGVLATLACAVYGAVLLADALIEPGVAPFWAVTRAVHVAAVVGFMIAIAPRLLKHPLTALCGKAAVLVASLLECLVVGYRLRLAWQQRDGVVSRGRAWRADDASCAWGLGWTVAGVGSDGLGSWLLLGRAIAALGVSSTFAAAGPPPEGRDAPSACPYPGHRLVAGAAISVYAAIHAVAALRSDDVVSMVFHFGILTTGFACWAAVYADETAWWLTATFCFAEAIAAASLAAAGWQGPFSAGSAEDEATLARVGGAAALLLLISLLTLPVAPRPQSSFMTFAIDGTADAAQVGARCEEPADAKGTARPATVRGLAGGTRPSDGDERVLI